MFLLLAPFSAPSVKILIYTRGALYWRRKTVRQKNKKVKWGGGGRRRIGELEERGEDGQWIRARDYCVYLRWRAGEEENGATNEVDVTKIFEKKVLKAV